MPNRAARHRALVLVPSTDYTDLTNCFYMYALQLWTLGLCFSPPHMSSDASSTCWIVDCNKATRCATADATQVRTIRLPGICAVGVCSGQQLAEPQHPRFASAQQATGNVTRTELTCNKALPLLNSTWHVRRYANPFHLYLACEHRYSS